MNENERSADWWNEKLSDPETRRRAAETLATRMGKPRWKVIVELIFGSLAFIGGGFLAVRGIDMLSTGRLLEGLITTAGAVGVVWYYGDLAAKAWRDL